VLTSLGIEKIKVTETTNEFLSAGLSYALKNKVLVDFGQVKKSITKKFDIKEEVYFADFNWEVLVKAASFTEVKFAEVSKFPGVRRDLALLLDQKIKYKEIEELAFATERKFLKEINLFDIYQGDKIAADKKSYAVSFMLQDEEATLNEKQIETIMSKLIKAYEEKLGASLRS
jgi:phenylalanyl-tRNA synthetase beta chain